MICPGSAKSGLSTMTAASRITSRRKTAPRGLTSVRRKFIGCRLPSSGRHRSRPPPSRGRGMPPPSPAPRLRPRHPRPSWFQPGPKRARRRTMARRLYTATAATITTPRTTSLRKGLTCMTLITLSTTAKIATPPIVPHIEPRPPRAAFRPAPPPRSTAVRSRPAARRWGCRRPAGWPAADRRGRRTPSRGRVRR